MIVRTAREQDFPGFLDLAAGVEQWFGPMVGEPGFHRAVRAHVELGTALVAVADHAPSSPLLGGLLFGVEPPTLRLHWLVVSGAARGRGVGRALVDGATNRLHRVLGPGPAPDAASAVVEVVTFRADHPGAADSGARVFYERLGFVPEEAAEPGPEGGPRQVYRRVCRRGPDSAAPGGR
ncbi:GNAT family N-acetyltransferase [Streptomyces sp. XM4193]|uniref:GNAT family N-acetyltransferase n=1 Tax=Streptomyces sp. XM4193 TaxID=2929782 RepID=UPI001FFA3297|nr:GNAT family N-acetyltransferase [Streptomyces sp. XM4193]MCK1798504.1 GNAT family N-acetyltransferase [Streptomyces sp. XM4193]